MYCQSTELVTSTPKVGKPHGWGQYNVVLILLFTLLYMLTPHPGTLKQCMGITLQGSSTSHMSFAGIPLK